MKVELRKWHGGKRGMILCFLLPVLYGCIDQKLTECPLEIHVEFYSKTPCSADTVYPQVQDVKLYLFDRYGGLIASAEENQVLMSRNYRYTLNTSNGIFTVVAWGGLHDCPFNIRQTKEIISKTDLLFRLQREALQTSSFDSKRIFYGESPVVYLPDPAIHGSVFEHTAINMREITNRITVSVEGLLRAEDYEVVIESANGSMNADGSIAQDEVIRYTPFESVVDNVLESRFTLLKLETGLNSVIIIKDKRDDRELFRGDLLGTLLLKNPNVNLACDHDFDIRFTAEDQCSCGSYVMIQIKVNEWIVHSYNTEL